MRRHRGSDTLYVHTPGDISRKTLRSAQARPRPDSVINESFPQSPKKGRLSLTSPNLEPGQTLSEGRLVPASPSTGGAEPGSEWKGQSSEPGPRRPSLGVPQSDEPVGLPPARQQSPVRGRVKCPMCGFPCKQDLELQREAGVSTGHSRQAAATQLSLWPQSKCVTIFFTNPTGL